MFKKYLILTLFFAGQQASSMSYLRRFSPAIAGVAVAYSSYFAKPVKCEGATKKQYNDIFEVISKCHPQKIEQYEQECGSEIEKFKEFVNLPKCGGQGYSPTPLCLATGHRNHEAVKSLLMHGAHVDLPYYDDLNGDPVTPLHLVIMGCRNDVPKKSLEIAETLMKHGANVNGCFANMETPLQSAAKYNAVEMAALLVTYGADVNKVSGKHFQSPLHSAASSYNDTSDMARFLISKGGKVRLKDIFGDTPLHNASYRGNIKVAQTLLNNGADINSQNIFGGTPLHETARSGYDDAGMAGFLVANKADTTIKDNKGKTALEMASPRVANVIKSSRI